ncbi:sulfate adenylyltransferase subunit 2 [Saccharothrix sp. AJ9571]|nr:sulfate adenylyltransferase subunit 2 [Saccharothrix sp. AJ9571]
MTPGRRLRQLESEAIAIIREVTGFRRPALLFSGGKDSAVLLELACRAFAPAPLPFPLLHIDTGHNFPEVLGYRDATATRHRARLLVASVEDAVRDGVLPAAALGGESRNKFQSKVLLHTIGQHGFDALLGGARRDEEKARAKERVFSLRDTFGRWDPRAQRPELWEVPNTRLAPGQNMRVFPLSNWTELDVWTYIAARDVPLPPLYFAHERAVFERDGILLDAGTPARREHDPAPVVRSVRYRTVGDMTCTGAVLSTSRTVAEVLEEVLAARITERGATRADDRVGDAAMEDRKKEGYF